MLYVLCVLSIVLVTYLCWIKALQSLWCLVICLTELFYDMLLLYVYAKKDHLHMLYIPRNLNQLTTAKSPKRNQNQTIACFHDPCIILFTEEDGWCFV